MSVICTAEQAGSYFSTALDLRQQLHESYERAGGLMCAPLQHARSTEQSILSFCVRILEGFTAAINTSHAANQHIRPYSTAVHA
eukprot:20784-Heterococcus_DN1.PRE.5